eukprot:3722556-Amphidinium_carterae.1
MDNTHPLRSLHQLHKRLALTNRVIKTRQATSQRYVEPGVMSLSIKHQVKDNVFCSEGDQSMQTGSDVGLLSRHEHLPTPSVCLMLSRNNCPALPDKQVLCEAPFTTCTREEQREKLHRGVLLTPSRCCKTAWK